MPADLEKVVVNPHTLDSQKLGPNTGDIFFGGRLWRLKGNI
jgi:hypothetical protein